MSNTDPVAEYAESVGAPSVEEFAAAYLVASWYDELCRIYYDGEPVTGLIPQGTSGRLRDCGVFVGGVGSGSKTRVDIERVEALAASPWLPDYRPDPSYLPVVEDHELSEYHPSDHPSAPTEDIGAGDSLGDTLPEEDAPLPDDDYNPDDVMNLDYWPSDDDMIQWHSAKDVPPERRYRV